MSEQPSATTEEAAHAQQADGAGARLPRVFYATRTPSQIAQVVMEVIWCCKFTAANPMQFLADVANLWHR